MASNGRAPERILIDNSVWARLGTTPGVRTALAALVNAYSPSRIMICPPSVAEFGFSARSGAEHAQVVTHLAAFTDCPIAPTSFDVLDIQNRLWNGGFVRGVGAVDTVIAAYALRNDAAVLHYDRDFEHVAAVTPGFRHEWVIPRGTA